MKKFAAKAVVLAIGAACGGSVLAGSISSPATDAAATVYAVEALTSGQDLTLPSVVYTMGVNRSPTQDFTVIINPSSGAAFTAGSCAAAVPTFGAAFTDASASVKRASTTECAYEIDVSLSNANAVTAGPTATMTFAGLVLDSHTLNVAGNSASVTIALKDLGETAYIDNVGSLTRKVATSVQSVNIYAATSDTGTTADVNATGGPLTGFLVAGDDTLTTAKAQLTFDNNFVAAMNATNTAVFDFAATTGTASVTLSGTMDALAANGLCLDVDNDATLCETGEKFTVAGSAGTLSGIPSSAFGATGTKVTRNVTFLADGTSSLGTSRTFAVTGTITPQVGAAEPLADTASKNSTFWVWTANASQLMTPYISTNAQYVTRVSLLNTGTADVTYSVTCYTEGTATAVNGANGTLKGRRTTVVSATDLCTFSDATKPRGAILFTINAPINTVKGTYNIADAVTGANGFVPLTRPYNAANTTE